MLIKYIEYGVYDTHATYLGVGFVFSGVWKKAGGSERLGPEYPCSDLTGIPLNGGDT